MGGAQALKGTARAYGESLLAALGVSPAQPLGVDEEHPALGWAASGLMALTGRSDGAPQMCPIPLTACADGALAALASLGPPRAFGAMRGSRLLAERAAMAGLHRAGAKSAGGSCRLLATADGSIALNLARADDWALLPAWLQRDVAADWSAVAEAVRAFRVDDLIERGRLLGLAVAANALPGTAPAGWCVTMLDVRAEHHVATPQRPRVVDLSSLWAGPLCGHLLQQLGAEVIKVESVQRPDGARSGPAEFFDLLHAGQRSVAVDVRSKSGRAQLKALLDRADIVIEASRPRALRQLGIHAEALLREHPQLTWLSITGHGRDAAHEQAIAYGDDAAVAAGLSYWQQAASGEPLFCGDAIADPLTGLHAALAAWATHCAGGGRLLSVSLCEVVRHCIAFDAPQCVEHARTRAEQWTQQVREAGIEMALPLARAVKGRAAALGADTEAVFRQLGIAC
ncbi:MAG: CoA transferase [Pseudomonadota bacterium]